LREAHPAAGQTHFQAADGSDRYRPQQSSSPLLTATSSPPAMQLTLRCTRLCALHWPSFHHRRAAVVFLLTCFITAYSRRATDPTKNKVKFAGYPPKKMIVRKWDLCQHQVRRLHQSPQPSHPFPCGKCPTHRAPTRTHLRRRHTKIKHSAPANHNNDSIFGVLDVNHPSWPAAGDIFVRHRNGFGHRIED
jgi:hypothetical protein